MAWTEEQKEAARARMKARWAERKGGSVAVVEEVVSARPIVEMSPERLAKLAAIQGRMIASDPQANAAMQRHEAEKLEAARVGVRDVMLRVSSDGNMVSLLGPCVCGAEKREWHKICLREAERETMR